MRDVGDDLTRLRARPIAHRGLHACGGPGPVENSQGAALAAIQAGYGIECDVQLSRDGEAMVFHDECLDRLTGVTGRLADCDAAALRRHQLRGSTDHVPTLRDFLNTIDGRVALVVEIKSHGADAIQLADRTLALLETYEGPAALESFDPDVVMHCRERGSPRPVGLVGPAERGPDPDPTVVAASDFLSWSIEDLARIAALYPSVPRTTWTVRTRAQAARARGLDAQIVFEGFEV